MDDQNAIANPEVVTPEIVDPEQIVLVRWIGQRRRYYHMTDAQGYGLYHDPETNKLPIIGYDAKWETVREVPFIGLTERLLLESDDPIKFGGLSRGYKFGPEAGTFTQPMPIKDWLIVQAAWSNPDIPLPFALVGEDDDGGRLETAAEWRDGDIVYVDVESAVEERERQKREIEERQRNELQSIRR